jgi:hypothetical protein
MHSLLTSPPAIRHDEKAKRSAFSFLIVAGTAALLMQATCAYAQHASAPAGMSDKEKAKIQEKRAFQKDTDDAYQSTMSRLPDVKQQKVDPWGNMRGTPQK